MHRKSRMATEAAVYDRRRSRKLRIVGGHRPPLQRGARHHALFVQSTSSARKRILKREPAAVDAQQLACYIGRGIGSEINRGADDLSRLSKTSERHLPNQRVQVLWVFA